MKLQVCRHGTQKERRICANRADVGDFFNPLHDTTAGHQFALELSLLH